MSKRKNARTRMDTGDARARNSDRAIEQRRIEWVSTRHSLARREPFVCCVRTRSDCSTRAVACSE